MPNQPENRIIDSVAAKSVKFGTEVAVYSVRWTVGVGRECPFRKIKAG